MSKPSFKTINGTMHMTVQQSPDGMRMQPDCSISFIVLHVPCVSLILPRCYLVTVWPRIGRRLCTHDVNTNSRTASIKMRSRVLDNQPSRLHCMKACNCI
jgi:hypothetical protein